MSNRKEHEEKTCIVYVKTLLRFWGWQGALGSTQPVTEQLRWAGTSEGPQSLLAHSRSNYEIKSGHCELSRGQEFNTQLGNKDLSSLIG